jgi:hypothetical protein
LGALASWKPIPEYSAHNLLLILYVGYNPFFLFLKKVDVRTTTTNNNNETTTTNNNNNETTTTNNNKTTTTNNKTKLQRSQLFRQLWVELQKLLVLLLQP